MCVWLCRLAASEALSLDPQSRILLEQTHLALADARPFTGSLLDTKTGK
jgi:acyl transferase domain-containing protein